MAPKLLMGFSRGVGAAYAATSDTHLSRYPAVVFAVNDGQLSTTIRRHSFSEITLINHEQGLS